MLGTLCVTPRLGPTGSSSRSFALPSPQLYCCLRHLRHFHLYHLHHLSSLPPPPHITRLHHHRSHREPLLAHIGILHSGLWVQNQGKGCGRLGCQADTPAAVTVNPATLRQTCSWGPSEPVSPKETRPELSCRGGQLPPLALVPFLQHSSGHNMGSAPPGESHPEVGTTV